MEDIKKISQEDKEEIVRQFSMEEIKQFSMEEIKEAIFGMKNNKAPGPDGFPAEFYKHFWDTIKVDLKEIVDDFHSGGRGIERLNYGVVTLVPKCKDASQI